MSKKLKTHLKLRVSALAVASCLGGVPLMADAAGLGRITVYSALGQPLRAEIEVNANKDELPGMAAKIASPEAFRQAGLEYAGALTGVKVAVDKRPSGQPFIRLSSDRPLSDPFIDVLLELNWSSGRLVREYTFLLDPPEMPREVATSAPTAAPAKTEEKTAQKPAEKPAEKAPEKAAEKAVEAPSEKAAEKPGKRSVNAVAAKPENKPAEGEGKAAAAQRQVKSGDTLVKIANEVKPEGVALEQMLVGLFRANPDAFQGNMNRLKSGKILNVPAKDSVESVAAPEARKEVLAQAQDWNAYRRKLAGVTAQEPAVEKPAQKESVGKITAKVEEKAAAPVDTKDQVKVSKTQTTGAQPPAVKKSSAEEEKIAREKALKESAERAAQLEKNVADLQKLAELKNKQLAQAQAAAKPAEPAQAAKPAEPPKPAPVAEVAKPASPAAAVAPAAPTAPVAPATEAAKPAEPPKAEAGKPGDAAATPPAPPAEVKPADAPKPKPKPKAPPPPPVEEEDDGMLLGLVGGVAALLGGIGGLIFYRRRKAAQGAGEAPVITPSLGEPSLGANSVFRATGGQSIDTSAATPAVTDFSQTGPGTIDTDEVDPVAEAEVYMAYGRDAQAEEILLEALQKDGKRLAIHLKLLEIYAQRKSAKQFETLATELYAQTGGHGSEWEKAVAMGSKLDPANPLYSAGGNAASAPSPFGAAPLAAASGFDPDATVVVSSKVDTPAQTLNEAPAVPSFDLNVGELPAFGEAPDAGAFAPSDTLIKGEPMAAAGGAESFALDFDLDLGGAASTPVTSPAAAAPKSVPDLDLGGGLDFDLKLGDSHVAPNIDAEPVNKTDLSSISLDLGEPADSGGVMDFESTLLAPPGMSDGMATDIIGGMGNASDPAVGGSAQEQAVATKLDLAKAYEEMGDAEGARELLQEVIAEGTAAQREAAKASIARLG